MHIFHKCLALRKGYPNLALSKQDKLELNNNNQKSEHQARLPEHKTQLLSLQTVSFSS